MGHMLDYRSHVSIPNLVGLMIAITTEIWDRKCGRFRPRFAVFAILGHVWNTISPWGKGCSRMGLAIPVAEDQGSIAIEFRNLLLRPSQS